MTADDEARKVAVVDVIDVHRRYGATQALRGVSLSVGPGEIHGLCGQNGAGKSTLVRILTGQTTADAGTIRVRGAQVELGSVSAAQEAGVAAVDQELSVVNCLTVRENLMLGSPRRPLFNRVRADRRQARAMLDRVGLSSLSPDASCEQLSMAQLQLIEIARLLGRSPQLLILDEPTASLSRADSLVVFQALREMAAQGHSVLYVSHRLDEVLDLCDRITVLRDGLRVADERADRLDQASLIHLITGDVEAAASSRPARRSDDSAPAGPDRVDQRVEVRVSVRDKVEDVALTVHAGRIIGLAGQVGSGATEFLRAAAGLVPGAQVEIKIGGDAFRPRRPADATNRGIAFVSNDRKGEGLFMDMSVGHNLVATRLADFGPAGIVSRRDLSSVSGRLAGALQVKTRSVSAKMTELSGGNQQKVFVGRCLERSDVRLLLLDEPTRGVDVHGRAEIHQLVRTACADGIAVIFASGDPDEVLDLADEIVCLSHGSVVSHTPAAEMTGQRLLTETTRAVSPDDAVTA
jgi:ABC-type sugar transport system ATPase subunit